MIKDVKQEIMEMVLEGNKVFKSVEVTYADKVSKSTVKDGGYAVVKVQTYDEPSTFTTFERKVWIYQKMPSVTIMGHRISFNSWNHNLMEVKEIYSTKGTKVKSSGVREETPQVPVIEEVEVVDWTKPVKHKEYETIKQCLVNNIPVYLAGPAGSGKNYTVEEIAGELGWDFYFTNSVQQEYKLTGFIDAGGLFHETEFYKALTSENHSIFFLDEIDASIPEVLVLLNAAIANGYFEFPNGRVDFDKVHFVAAGNTVGNGADDLYTGRMSIDQATLDRFVIIEFDYDKNIEMSLTKGNKQLVDFIRSLRAQSKEHGIRTTFSYRALMSVTKLEGTNISLTKILKIAVFKGLDVDTTSTFQFNYEWKHNKYVEAFNTLRVINQLHNYKQTAN